MPRTFHMTLACAVLLTAPRAGAAEAGVLYVKSDPPGALIFVDGELKGETPKLVKVTPGDHQVIVGHPDAVTRTERVSVEAGKLTTLEVPLTPTDARAVTAEPGPPGGQAASDLAQLMPQFEESLRERAYSKAGGWAEATSREAAFAHLAHELRAAAEVARALETRATLIRRAAEGLEGRDVTLQTRSGGRTGNILVVADEGITLAAQIKVGPRVVGTTRYCVQWDELAHEQEEELARGWGDGPSGAIAHGLLGLWRNDLDAAERALAGAAGHPLAPYLQGRIATMKPAPAPAPPEREEPPAPRARIAGLVGHWTLDEPDGGTVRDSSTGGNHGTIHGTRRVQGRVGAARSFNGAGEFISAGATGLPAPYAAQSICFWMLVQGIPQNTQCCVSLKNEPAGSAVQAGFRGGRFVMWRWGARVLVSAPSWRPGGWHHCAYTFDGTTHTLYVDGVPVDSSRADPADTPPDSLLLGKAGGPGEHFEGALDDVRIYNRALSQAEIGALSSMKGRATWQ